VYLKGNAYIRKKETKPTCHFRTTCSQPISHPHTTPYTVLLNHHLTHVICYPVTVHQITHPPARHRQTTGVKCWL